MNFSPSQRTVVQSILANTYTQHDLREFVRLCHALALPLIRKKMLHGRFDLDQLGLRLNDLVYDCIADLFVRDSDGRFTEICRFFEKELADVDKASDALVYDTLRRIVFGSVSVNLIRVHGSLDPTFGKILHNVDVALTRTKSFERFVRFGDSMLGCRGSELNLHLPPPTLEYLRDQFSREVLVHDSVPSMLGKLGKMLEHQAEYQRVIPLFWAVLLFKEVYALGAEEVTPAESTLRSELEEGEILELLEAADRQMRVSLYPGYVGSGKMHEDEFEAYARAAKEIVADAMSNGAEGGRSYYEVFKNHVVGLGREEYINEHKSILEYFVKIARQSLADQLRSQESAR